MKRVLIFGATSAIAEATAREFAARGNALFLVARAADRLSATADDLKVRGAKSVATYVLNARETERLGAVLEAAVAALGGLDAALIAHGTLSDQKACEQSAALMLDEFSINALSVMALCTELANFFERQRHGTLAVISSVAGDRGRSSNYVYGAAKAAISAFLSGLGQRLRKSDVQVVTIKPGFVATPMTAAFKKGALWAQPGAVAKLIVSAMDRGTPVLYAPWFWRPVMFVIRAIPERVFRRLSL